MHDYVGISETMPKHRSTVYTVVRNAFTESGWGQSIMDHSTIVGTYLTHDRADEVRAAYQQEMKDRGIDDIYFEVQASTWYEE